MTPKDIEIRRESMDSSSAKTLIVALNAELSERYSGAGTEEHFHLQAQQVVPGRGVFLVAYVSGQPRACGAIRLIDADTVEIKRMYVDPTVRSLGVGRRVLESLEAEARTLGAKAIVLETGPRQPEAIALYSGAGFLVITAYGDHVSSPMSVFMGKALEPATSAIRHHA
jgi:GNAT superfamily N-acetyltransferase